MPTFVATSCLKTGNLNIIAEFTLEPPVIRIDRRFNSADVINVLSDLFILYSIPPDGFATGEGQRFSHPRGSYGRIGTSRDRKNSVAEVGRQAGKAPSGRPLAPVNYSG
ncbi:hypothetical protein ACUSIJ_11330 [Pseudochelatococcus sp. B33]